MAVVVRAVIIGTVIVLVGTIPRDLFYWANLHFYASVPWAAPVTAAYLWFFWRYLRGAGPPAETSAQRRTSLRANRLSARQWTWALLAGVLGLVALVLALRVANRMVALPQQGIPDLSHVPRITVLTLLLMGAPFAGVIEESAFRGYMQGPIERRYGLLVAILITGTMFALVHLDFTPILWPYYVAVAAIYGTVAYATNSILPAIVLHTAGNVFSNLDLWLHGQAEWQTPSAGARLIWKTGADASFSRTVAALAILAAVAVWANYKLIHLERRTAT
ncbi:MAG TPA: CPBP family intramembrane glutamic endopeptidase [Verrucomicrobiae bacterium]|nr:CPBP family intramembrane glutamic endopeptidase [Verrucomicrobiae bacterium]